MDDNKIKDALNKRDVINAKDYSKLDKLQQEQMLKLITGSFYNDLVNYGIKTNEIINVSTHLLDCIMQKNDDLVGHSQYYSKDFNVADIRDELDNSGRIIIENVSISRLKPEQYLEVEGWLKRSAIKYSFITLFPESVGEFKAYFEHPARYYFCIFYESEPVGLIGGENLDSDSLKIEMRKFIGEDSMQGKGIGKRATFLFLYYLFVISKLNKVYIYSRDTNISNINLNSKFGFELEGILFEEVIHEKEKHDVVRMGLLRNRWMNIFTEFK